MLFNLFNKIEFYFIKKFLFINLIINSIVYVILIFVNFINFYSKYGDYSVPLNQFTLIALAEGLIDITSVEFFIILVSSIIFFWIFSKNNELGIVMFSGSSLSRIALKIISVILLLTIIDILIIDNILTNITKIHAQRLERLGMNSNNLIKNNNLIKFENDKDIIIINSKKSTEKENQFIMYNTNSYFLNKQYQIKYIIKSEKIIAYDLETYFINNYVFNRIKKENYNQDIIKIKSKYNIRKERGKSFNKYMPQSLSLWENINIIFSNSVSILPKDIYIAFVNKKINKIIIFINMFIIAFLFCNFKPRSKTKLIELIKPIFIGISLSLTSQMIPLTEEANFLPYWFLFWILNILFFSMGMKKIINHNNIKYSYS